MPFQHFLTPLLALLLCSIFIPFLRILAIKAKLTDTPNHRKVHTLPVPLIGGVSVFAAAWLTTALMIDWNLEHILIRNLFIPSGILLAVGVIDDRFDIRASIRLIIQLVLAHYIFHSGIRIESFYGFMGIHELMLWQQYLLTVIVITGVVNAMNLMDGIDGLAGGMALIASSVLIVISFLNGDKNLMLLFLSVLGALISFLKFNFSKSRKVFMGDAGSLFLGFLISVAAISQLPSSLDGSKSSWTLVANVAILIIPVLDALRVFRNRIKAGHSPFHADKTHLHHLLIFLGLPHKKATAILLIITVLLLVMGVLLNQQVGAVWAIMGMAIIFYAGTSLLEFHHKILHWSSRIHHIEISD